jgi:hypothetical protein
VDRGERDLLAIPAPRVRGHDGVSEQDPDLLDPAQDRQAVISVNRATRDTR